MYFPMITEMKGKKVLIAGGGKVAFHKAEILLPFEPDITVISPEFVPDFSDTPFYFDLDCSGQELILRKNPIEKTELPVSANSEQAYSEQKVGFVKRKILDKDIITSDIVIAATGDRKTDSHISEIAQKNKIPVNVVDVPELCTFIFPAMLNEGPLHISVSTSGKSPAAAAKIRDEIKNNLPDFLPELIDRLGEIRNTVTNSELSHNQKKEIFSNLYEYGISHDGNIPDEVVQSEIAGAHRN